MEPLITPPTASQTPASSKKKYLIGGGILALVLVGVVAYSMMSPAEVFKGTGTGPNPRQQKPNPEAPNKPGVLPEKNKNGVKPEDVLGDKIIKEKPEANDSGKTNPETPPATDEETVTNNSSIIGNNLGGPNAGNVALKDGITIDSDLSDYVITPPAEKRAAANSPEVDIPNDAGAQVPVCNAAQHMFLVGGQCAYVVNDSEDPIQPAAPAGVKQPAGTVAAGSGLGAQIAGRMSRGNIALPGEVIPEGKTIISEANAIDPKILKLLGDTTCPSGLVPQTNGTCKAKPEPIPAKATPAAVAVTDPAPTVINNYYSSGYVDNSLDQATLDRIAALEAQIAAANKPAAAGEVLVQADPSALTQLQIELANLQNVVKKTRAKNSQLATAEGAVTPSQTGAKPAANSTTQTAATARNTNGLHGAAIRGESGPEVLLYPAILGLAQGAYVLVKRRRK